MIGCMAAGWGIAEFPVFWRQSSLERIADRIVAGQPFNEAVLARRLPAIQSIESATFCRPAAIRSAAIIRLRMVELAESPGEQKYANGNMRSLDGVIRSSLSCSPADPFLWLVLYWVEGPQNSLGSADPGYLRLSYQLGPNEGWIGLKRNRFVMAEFEKLPADLEVSATNEFTSLLESGFYGQVADIFIAQPSRMRDLLLSRLQNVAERHRRALSNVLYAKGEDIEVPGIERTESRPRH
jgi:hypothetical protein